MKALYAMYPTPEAAQRAVNGLRAAGFADKDITIMSSEPLEHYEFGRKDAKTKMTWIAALGAMVGCISAYFLTSLTEQWLPVNVGGMPTVTNWSNMIVIFELTMLGAIFATVGTLLVTAGIPSRMPKFYDPEVSDGKILVGIANPTNVAGVEGALRAGGATELRTIA